jgi:hypothetical protein
MRTTIPLVPGERNDMEIAERNRKLEKIARAQINVVGSVCVHKPSLSCYAKNLSLARSLAGWA